MKKSNVLAIALSAGLVLGGAYVSDANVAYAAEDQAQSKEELEKELEVAKAQLAKRQAELEEAKSSINNTAYKRRVDNAQVALDQAKASTGEAQSALAAAQAAKTSADSAVEGQKVMVSRIKRRIAEDDTPQNQRRLVLQEEKLAQLQAEADLAASSLAEAEAAANSVNAGVESAEAELTTANAKLEQYKAHTLKAYEDNVAQAQRRVDNAQAALDAAPEISEEAEENNVNGYKTKKAAREAGIEERNRVWGENPKTHKVVAEMGANGRWFYTINPILVNPNDTDGYETEEEAINAAKEALEDDPINNSYNVSQRADGRWVYVLSATDPEESQEEKEEFIIKGHIYRPYESKSFADFTIDSKNYDNDFSKTVSAAYDYVNTAYGTKYRVEVADGGYTLNFHLLEEEIALTPLEPSEEIEKETPWSPLVPAKKHDTDITPNPGHVIIPSETIEDETTEPSEDKPSVDRDKEQEAKDLTDKLNKITKEIEDTLIENEKNIDDKKPSEEEKPSNEKPSEEKPAKENKPTADENKVEKKVVAKKVAKHDNPKTGVVAMSSVVSTLAISMTGIVATRKKK